MSTPPNTPPTGGPRAPFPPGDPRNAPYGPGYPVDPRVQREQAKAWQHYQKHQERAARQQAKMAVQAQRAQFRAWRSSNRSQSVIGPLLLIGVAVTALLVYNGKLPLDQLVNWFARWWPVVLIAAGLLRLAEWAVARHRSESTGVPVRFTIGGGTVWLLIMISLLGLASRGGLRHDGDHWNFGWNGADFNQFFGSKHEEDAVAVTHSIAAEGTLEIHNDHGDVTVVGDSDDGLVHLAEHKEVFANDDSRVRSLMESLDPTFQGTDAQLVVNISSGDNRSASVKLSVPHGVHVVLNSGHGDVAVHSFRAPVSVNANRGDVDLSGIAGDVSVHSNSRNGTVQVHSVRGAVELSGSGDDVNLNDIEGAVTLKGNFLGSGHLRHVTGAVNLNAGRISFSSGRIDGEVSYDEDDEFTARGVAGPIAVHTRSRNITLDRVSGALDIANSSGHVEITAVAPTGAISVTNRDGDVSLSLPNSAKFSIAAETTDGTIDSSFPGLGDGTTSSHRGILNASIGSGPGIRLNTTHGNIEVSSNEQVPVPPVPPTPPALTAIPPEASQALSNARRDVKKARQQGEEARREGMKAAAEGRAEAAKARDEALEEARKAQESAQRDRQ